MKKCLFLISGITTAGKSSLALNVMDNLPNGIVYPICNFTHRASRNDDDPRFIRSVGLGDYKAVNGFKDENDVYRFSADQVDYFIDDSEYKVAVGIVSFKSLAEIKNSNLSNKVRIESCLLRLSNTPEGEKEALKERITSRFSGNSKQVTQRYDIHNELIEKYVHNTSFVQGNIDIILSHEKYSETDMYKEVLESLGL